MVNQDSCVGFREEQRFIQPWLWLLLAGGDIAFALIFGYLIYKQNAVLGKTTGVSVDLIGIMAAMSILFTLVLLAVFKLITEVRSDGLYIRFVPFHRLFRKISLDDVKQVQAVTYNPLGDYGGWGIRYGCGGRAFNVTGNRGVRIVYNDGKHILIGSQRPDELVRAIEPPGRD